MEYIKDTFNEYLSQKERISASDIKNFLKSPRYYYYEKYEKQKEDKSEQRHFIVGSALHELLLEPELFNANYILSPKFDRRTTIGKNEFEAFKSLAGDKVVLFADEMDMIVLMAENALKNNTLTELMKESYKEVSCYCEDDVTGLKLRLRPDSMAKNKSTIVDVKTCLNSSLKDFKSNVYSYGYSISAAFYSDFLKRENYIFCAIEKEQPYQVALYSLSDEMMEYGRTQYRMGLDLIKWSLDNDYWATHNEFEILKECYLLGNLNDYFDILNKSEQITIIN